MGDPALKIRWDGESTKNRRNRFVHKHETFRQAMKDIMAIPGFWHQVYTALAVSAAAFSAGNAMGWSAPMFLHLIDPHNQQKVHFNKTDTSYILVCMQLSSILHMAVTGCILVRYGRKAGCWFLNFLPPIGYAFLAEANSNADIYLGSSLIGTSMISGVTVGLVYLSEITSDRLRGPLISLLIFFNSCGILMSHILGEYLEWEPFNYTCLVVSLIFSFAFWRLPESPQYLVLNSKLEEAKKNMSWYHGGDPEVIETEMKKLEQFREWSGETFKSLFTDRGARRGITISVFLAVMSELCGTSIIENYVGLIVLDSNNPPISAKRASIVLAVFRFIAGLINVYMVERSGRKFTLLVSIMKMTLTLISLSIFLAVHVKNTDFKYWGTLICLILYTLANQTFFATAEVIMGEVLPAETKDMTLSIAGSIRVFIVILSVQAYAGFPTCETYYNFVIESIFCIIGVIVALYLIPETQGKTLEEIRELLGKGGHSKGQNPLNDHARGLALK